MGVARKSERRGIGSPSPSISPFFPFLSPPSLSLPSFPLPSSLFPLPSRSSSPLPTPLIQLGYLGQRCKLPREFGRSPAAKRFCAIFSANQRILYARTGTIFIFPFQVLRRCRPNFTPFSTTVHINCHRSDVCPLQFIVVLAQTIPSCS